MPHAFVPGICVCQQTYAGVDCSLRSADSPVISSRLDNIICDISKFDCSVVSIFGSQFISSDILTCHLVVANVNILYCIIFSNIFFLVFKS